ncbi:F26 [Felid gammaherpesvirus 1]|uniref:F26 n=1 Tax=Felid gammaherpesvirus 1 TaxID=2560468 RepID=A0A0M4M4K2_9GAMA|nr:F26 [Felis catus gammaherpesvirus 1]ALE14793.1 F26 [Felis catus gammaherpesvirus 1]
MIAGASIWLHVLLINILGKTVHASSSVITSSETTKAVPTTVTVTSVTSGLGSSLTSQNHQTNTVTTVNFNSQLLKSTDLVMVMLLVTIAGLFLLIMSGVIITDCYKNRNRRYQRVPLIPLRNYPNQRNRMWGN